MSSADQNTPPPEQASISPVEAELSPVTGSPISESWIGRLSISGMLSWIVVFGVTAYLCFSATKGTFQQAASENSDAPSVGMFQMETQVKAAVAQNEIGGMAGSKEDQSEAMDTVLKSLDTGGYEQRLGRFVLTNEIKGPGEALDYLETLDQKVVDHELKLTEKQQRFRDTLEELVNAYESGETDADTLSKDEQEFLKSELGWVGELALLPPDSPDKKARKALIGEATSLIGLGIVALLLFGSALLVGFILAIVLIILAAKKKLLSGFKNHHHNHNIYIETFAIWMVVFFGSMIGIGYLGLDAQTHMLLQPVNFFGSLICLLWPIVRGLSFKQLRQDIGWTCERPIPDIGTSFLSYFSALPLIVPAALLVMLLVAIGGMFQEVTEFGSPATPGHPIEEYVANGNYMMIALIFVAVSICAPVVEETMFRGVLYRHLRDLTGKLGIWFSVLFSAIFNGFIFAACHPQGLFGIPVLMVLAFGFSMAREWRGSLLSPMLMHAAHNAFVTCIMLLFL